MLWGKTPTYLCRKYCVCGSSEKEEEKQRRKSEFYTGGESGTEIIEEINDKIYWEVILYLFGKWRVIQKFNGNSLFQPTL